MKIIKKILIGLLIIIAIPLILAIFMKKEYVVERQVTINKPVAEVFDYIKHIKNQDNYSVWNMADPNKKQVYRGTDGTVGFVNYWNGNDEVGEGEQEITKITENERLDLALRFKRPMESTAQAYMITEPAANNSTTVTWGMHGRSAYPFNFMNFMLDGMLGKDMEASLARLQKNLENKQ